jgi:hypothetical protein
MKNYVGKLVIDEVSKEKWAMQSYFFGKTILSKIPNDISSNNKFTLAIPSAIKISMNILPKHRWNILSIFFNFLVVILNQLNVE